MSYFGIIVIFWTLILAVSKIFRLEIVPKGKYQLFLFSLIFIFIVPGFLTDWIAISQEWYVFPKTTKYLWVTPIGIPIEEALFFATVPIWIIVLWKLCRKIA